MTAAAPLVWINDEIGAGLHPTDRGLAYGDGVFETLRVNEGQIPLWSAHRARLQHGASRLCLSAPLERIDVQLERLLAGPLAAGCWRLKLILTRGEGGHGYAPPPRAAVRPTLIWQATALQAPPPGPVRLRTVAVRLPIDPPLAGIKHLNRLHHVLAAAELAELDPSAQCEPLLLDAQGRVVESLHHNICWRAGEALHTADTTSAGVSGVLRDYLRHSGLWRWQPTAVASDALQRADEIFLVNALHGVRPVLQIDDGPTLPVGTHTRQLAHALASIYGAPAW